MAVDLKTLTGTPMEHRNATPPKGTRFIATATFLESVVSQALGSSGSVGNERRSSETITTKEGKNDADYRRRLQRPQARSRECVTSDTSELAIKTALGGGEGRSAGSSLRAGFLPAQQHKPEVAHERLTRSLKVRHSFSLEPAPHVNASARVNAAGTVVSPAVSIDSPARNIAATVWASMSRDSGTAVVNASMGTSDCCPSHITIHIDGKRGAGFSRANVGHGGRFGNRNTQSDGGRG